MTRTEFLSLRVGDVIINRYLNQFVIIRKGAGSFVISPVDDKKSHQPVSFQAVMDRFMISIAAKNMGKARKALGL